MLRKLSFLTLILVLSLVAVVPAFAASPNFSPAIYADGKAWGTKGLAVLPAPNDDNLQSFDKLYAFVNSNNPEQLPVSEAGPGNPDYNGGRWYTQTVMWTQQAFDDFGTVPVLKSYEDIMNYMSYLDIQPGSPDPVNGPPNFFECPLLPVK
jgi:hypothetical protein